MIWSLFGVADEPRLAGHVGLDPVVGATAGEELPRFGGVTGWSAGIPDRTELI